MFKVIRAIKNFYYKHEAYLSIEVLYYASSLSFYTLLTIVPLLLVIISIIAYIPVSELYLVQIKHYLELNLLPVQSEYLISFIDATFKQRAEIGFLGVLYAFIASIFFFYNYDYVISKMFSTKQHGFFKSLGLYTVIIIFIPFVWMFLITITAFLQTSAEHLFLFLPEVSTELVSLVTVWMMFLVMMKLSLFVKLSGKALASSSFIVALVWSAMQKLFLFYILHNIVYATLYGSFASIFFFFLWIYLSWIIFLYGVKLAQYLDETNRYIIKKL